MSRMSSTASGYAKTTNLVAARERLEQMLGCCDEDGQSLVEFALTLPLLLLVVTGLMQFAIAFNNYLLLTDATNIAARQLAISRGQTTDPCALVVNTVSAGAPLLKPASMTFKFNFNGTSYTGTSCTADAALLTANSTVTLTVTYPCSLKVYGATIIPAASCILAAQTAELVE